MQRLSGPKITVQEISNQTFIPGMPLIEGALGVSAVKHKRVNSL